MKKVAIYGYGKEGKAAAQYFAEQGDEVAVYDQNPNLEHDFKKINKAEDLAGYDVVVRSPSVNPKKLKHDNVTSVTNIFFEKFPGTIIAVTGTKGKGTTSTLIHEILLEDGRDSKLVGNIGSPAIEHLEDADEDSFAVYEISSFQLWDIKKSPHIAVVLMVGSDHLDIHDSLKDYHHAKQNIVKYQTEDDFVIHHPTNITTLTLVADAKSQRIPYMQPPGAVIKHGNIEIAGKKICGVDQVGLIGEHNLENICAAVSAVWQLGVGPKPIAKAIKRFKGLEHRLELVKTVAGIEYYNDSFSASTPSLIAALKSFQKPSVFIMGGSEKGADFIDVAAAVKTSSLKHALLIGKTAPKIAAALRQVGFDKFTVLEDTSMREVVKKAEELADEDDVVVLSPGCASFDMFENYIDRGNQFKEAVQKLDGTAK